MTGVSISERRRFGRRACRVHGWVRTSGRVRHACVMMDFSEGGARLSTPITPAVHSRLILMFDGFDAALACEVRHAADGSVGVEFVRHRAAQQANIDAFLRWLAG